MAYAVDPIAQQRRQAEANQLNGTAVGAGGAADAGTSGGSAAPLTGVSAGQPTPGTPAKDPNAGDNPNAGTSGTGFVNLQSYVNNNQQAAGQMSGAIANNVQAQGQNAQGEQASLKSQYGQQTAANTYGFTAPGQAGLAFPQQSAGAATANMAAGVQGAQARTSMSAPVSATAGNAAPQPVNVASSVQGVPQLPGAGAAPPAGAPASNQLGIGAFATNLNAAMAHAVGKQSVADQAAAASNIRQAVDPAAYAAAQATAANSYQGPNSLADLSGYQKAATDSQNASTVAQGLGNPGSIGTMLGAQYKNGYGGGQGGANEGLDTFLTQQKGQQQFDDLSQKYSGLSNNLAAATADTTAAGSAKAQDALASNAAQNFVTGEDANTKARTAYQGVLDKQAATNAQNNQDAKDYKTYQDYWQSYHKNFFHPVGSPFTPNSQAQFGSQNMSYNDWMKWRNSGQAPDSISTVSRPTLTGG